MTFLNPWLLLGLLGASVPLVIHLLSRRTARREMFSSLEFLRDLERRSMRRLRVRQLLLLLIRMLLIAAVAIAMARPTLTGVAAGGGGGSGSAVVLLDASFSMRGEVGGVPFFEQAVARAREILDTLEDGDEVFLMAPGAPGAGRPEGIRDLALARERLSTLEPGLSRVDGPAELQRAVRVLRDARHPNREIHVITDAQRSGWTEAGADGAAIDLEGARLFWHPLGEDPSPNAWIDEVDFSGQILEKGTPVQFRVVVATGPGYDPSEVEVELELDDQVVDRRRIDLGPGSRVGLTFQETFAEDGIHLGAVVIRGAAGIPEDDRRPFTLRTERSSPVLVICPDERSRKYLMAALAPQGGASGSFSVREGDVRELAAASRDRESVIVLADVERLAESELAGIKSFLSDGGGLLVLPGPRLDAAAWGRAFLPKFLPGTLADLRATDEPFGIAGLDPSHALFGLFRDGDGGLRDVRFTRALHFRPLPGTAVLATFANGDPAIVESSLLPGRVLFLTSGLDPAWSDLPLTGAFLPLLHEAVRYLSETGARDAEELDVGEGATVWLPSLPDGGTVTLRAPDGSERSVAPEPGPGGYALKVSDVPSVGFWILEAATGDTLAALAAGIASAESDPERIPSGELESRYAEGRAAVLEARTGLARAVKEARVGREIGRWFLWIAGALLALEMAIATRLRAASSEAAG